MDAATFLEHLQKKAASFASQIATNEGDWIIKGFIDIRRQIYTVSLDTKIISKVFELLLFPLLDEFAKEHSLTLELSPKQNFYPDLTYISSTDKAKFAVDVKSTYRTDTQTITGMTLGAFTGYFRDRESKKNILYPYKDYSGHFVLGVIYSQVEGSGDERKRYQLDDLATIPSVIRDFRFFVQPKFKIATTQPGSGNTKNIGSIKKIDELTSGSGPFSKLGVEVFDDYWMHFLTKDMARQAETPRPYTDLKSFLASKERSLAQLQAHKDVIASLPAETEEEVEE